MLNKKVFNGNGRSITISMDFVVTILAAIVLALGGWGLLRIANMSDCFATITQVEKVEASVKEVEKSCEDHYTSMDTKISGKIDTLEVKVSNQCTVIENKINGVEVLLKGYIYGSAKEPSTKR